MDFSGFQKGVHDIWQFLWPSVVIVLLLGGIALALAFDPLAALARRLLPFHRKLWGNRSIYKALRRFELIKLIPLIALFLMIFVLYVTREVALRVGDLVPVTVTSRPGPLLAHSTPHDDLVRLAACFPTISDMDRLAAGIEQRLSAEGGSTPAISNVRYWRENLGDAVQAFSIVKTLAMWSLFCALAGIVCTKRILLRRLFLCLLILFFAGVHYVAKQVYAIEQVGFAQSAAAQVLIVPTVASANPKFDEQVAKSQNTIAVWEKDSGYANNWWEVRILSSDFSWLRRTFLDAPY